MLKDIRDYLSYDPETGIFTWIKRPASCTHVGQIAGKANPRGYYILQFNGRQEYCHRIAFTLIGESLGKDEVVDHVNLDKGDNRWCNLRKASLSQNAQNRPKLTTNTSGAIGVCWDKRKSKWRVYCQHKHYGYFVKLDDAKLKYEQVSKELYKEFHIDS